MFEKITGKCLREGCTVEKDGKCLENIDDPRECPHFVPSNELIDESVPDKKEVMKGEELSDMVILHDGDDLTLDTATIITRAFITRVIVLAGAVGSGKTTLLASIYECFQSGPFANYLFAGCRTLPGFERRCYFSRIASERTMADTERTKYGTCENLLHLRVRVKDLNKPAQDLLFSDLSGETFRIAKDSTEYCQEIEILRLADHFVLLIDGEKLSKIENRQGAYHDANSLLRSCLDAGMLGNLSLIDVLFTKWDLIESLSDSNEKDDAKTFVNYIEQDMKNRFENRVGSLRFSRIASRPADSILKFAYGLESIFPSWVEEMPMHTSSMSYKGIRQSKCREFNLYLYRHLESLPGGEKH